MRTEHDKASIELAVFRDFVRIAALPVDSDSVEKRSPPEPDVLCRIEGLGQVAFELVELCDPNLARVFADPLKPSHEYVRTSDPSAGILRKKLRRAYDTPHPVELLCYTDGRIITPADVIIPTLRPYLGSFAHVFRKAWLLSEGRVDALWK